MHTTDLPLSARRPSGARPSGARRGSLLIVALVFCAILGVGITVYLRVSYSAMQFSQRSLLDNGAMNIAEAGLEHALWSFNQSLSGNSNAWAGANGWNSASGNNITGTLPSSTTYFDLPFGAKGQVKLYVQDYNSTGVVRPIIYARSIVTPKTGPAIEKYVEITIRRRSRFATGVVGRNSVRFNGNKTVLDSWNSVGSGNTTVTYSNSSRRSNGSVGSASVAVGSLNIGNADVYGYVSTAGIDPQVGSNGTVGQWGDTVGTVNQSRIARDFAANFDDVAAPAVTSSTNILTAIGGSITLPQTTSGNNPTITDSATTINGKTYYVYTVPSITLTSGSKVTITAGKNVIITATTSTGTSVSVTGNGGIEIGNGGTLQLYTAGDVKIAGNGVANGSNNGSGTNNMNQPIAFQLWGTRPYTAGGTPQDITVTGNGNLSAVVYAPFGDIKMAGSSSSGPGSARDDVYGSVVGYNITMLGEESFHYDESLATFDGSAPFGITKWREVSYSTDRATITSLVNF